MDLTYRIDIFFSLIFLNKDRLCRCVQQGQPIFLTIPMEAMPMIRLVFYPNDEMYIANNYYYQLGL